MSRKPRILTRCPASMNDEPDERTIEFSFPNCQSVNGSPKGGLISFRAFEVNGKLVPRVDIWRTDGEVQVLSPPDQPGAADELARLRAIESAARDLLASIDGGDKLDTGPLRRLLPQYDYEED